MQQRSMLLHSMLLTERLFWSCCNWCWLGSAHKKHQKGKGYTENAEVQTGSHMVSGTSGTSIPGKVGGRSALHGTGVKI
eukprot:40182-Pelagomonas_calceolata.AAC.3